MSAHRLKVLDLLSQGRVTVEEAERLLDKLGSGDDRASEATSSTGVSSPRGAEGEGRRTREPRFLRIVVKSCAGDKVNLRVPRALLRTGIKLAALLPEQARRQLEEHCLDLGGLEDLGREPIQAEFNLDLNTPDGGRVRLFWE